MHRYRLPTVLLLCFVLPSCSVLDSDGGEKVKVVEYNGPRITKDDATITDLIGERTWKAETDNQTVILTRLTLCGDECNEKYRLELSQRRGELPRFESASFRRKASDGGSLLRVTERRRLKEGQVAIQNWNTSGVVSGKVTGDLEFTFWYDIDK